MSEFKTWQSYNIFATSVKLQARYIFEDHVYEFLQSVINTSESRKLNLQSGQVFYRAQLGYTMIKCNFLSIREHPKAFPPERMKPLSHKAREGRVNPKGIPYLYMATDKETAMAEVRPWLGSYISIGKFEIVKDLVIVDCSSNPTLGPFMYLEEPPPKEREKIVWHYIDSAFSEPVSPDDSSSDYVPTQILAESFQKHGFDGIKYKSVLGKGFNYALFDINSSNLIEPSLYEVKDISFRFKKGCSSYYEKICME